jgi:hypothetical protein
MTAPVGGRRKLNGGGFEGVLHVRAAERVNHLSRQHTGVLCGRCHLPRDCSATHSMLRRANSLGVFQVESRARMNMLPRLPSRPHTQVPSHARLATDLHEVLEHHRA